MFTGIIEAVGAIVEQRSVSTGQRLSVTAGALADNCAPGASISVSGVCLTVAEAAPPLLVFDVIRETLTKSALGQRRPGDAVNLERSLRVGDRLDGHFVQGHVDGTAIIESVVASPEEYVLWLRPQPALRPYVIPKGSVAVEGVSLTVAAIDKALFSVALIPTTLERTNLSSFRRGGVMNLETDIIARTVVHSLSTIPARSGETLETLREG